MKHPLVHIIVLNWNGLEDTLECLGSVFKMDYPNFEVVVVDNASTDDSVEVIREAYPQVTLIDNKDNLGYTGGNNVAMKYAMENGADYVWLLNNDTTVEVDTLGKIVSLAEQSDAIGLVSPTSYYYDDMDRIEICGRYIDCESSAFPIFRDFKNIELWKSVYKEHPVVLWGTALLIKRRLVEEIGYLDEKFFAYWEDTDYSVRAYKAGYKSLVCTSSKIYHKYPLPETNKTRASHYFYFMSRNRFFLLTKHFNRRKLAVFWNHFNYVLVLTAYNRSNNDTTVDASLDGLWAAFNGVAGTWNKDIHMPAWLRFFLYPFFTWHPHFWVNLLSGHLALKPFEVIKKVITKCKASL